MSGGSCRNTTNDYCGDGGLITKLNVIQKNGFFERIAPECNNGKRSWNFQCSGTNDMNLADERPAFVGPSNRLETWEDSKSRGFLKKINGIGNDSVEYKDDKCSYGEFIDGYKVYIQKVGNAWRLKDITTKCRFYPNSPKEVNCPSNSFVDKLSIKTANDRISAIKATCSDGTVLGVLGDKDFGGQSNNDLQGPFNSIPGKVDLDGVHQIKSIGTDKGIAFDKICPSGKSVTGLRANTMNVSGDFISALLGVNCGFIPDTFCIDNLDHPHCVRTSDDIFNKACSKKLFNRCIDNKNRITDTTGAAICQKPENKGTEFCSCENPLPVPAGSLIPASLLANPKCWNKTCANKGYMRQNVRDYTCPNITICKQDVKIDGNSNLLDDIIFSQGCNSGGTSTGNTSGNTGSSGNNTSGTGTNNNKSDNTNNSDYTLYIIIFCVFFVVVLMMSMSGSNNDDYDDEYDNQPIYSQNMQRVYPQQMQQMQPMYQQNRY